MMLHDSFSFREYYNHLFKNKWKMNVLNRFTLLVYKSRGLKCFYLISLCKYMNLFFTFVGEFYNSICFWCFAKKKF